MTILIVDDSALIRRALRSSIERNGSVSVCGEAENGKIGVEMVKQLRPDTVILDLQMPVMNGLDAAREIVQIAPRTVMLMYTMPSSDQLLKDAQAAGIQKVFSKTNGGPNQLIAWLNNAPVQPERRNQSRAC